MASEASGFKGKVSATFDAARQRFAFVDHLVLMVQRYGKVHGNVLAGAVTYFGFLSFFPILALAFSVVGYISIAYPDARSAMADAIMQVFPGIISESPEPGKISLDQIASAKAAAGILGFLGVLYSGLGWLSGMRDALTAAFEIPPKRRWNFVVGKGIDVCVLAIIGLVMIFSVGISSVIQGLTGEVLGWVQLAGTAIGGPLVWSVGFVLGLAASTVLFFVIYRLLGKPDLPARALWQGALLGAIGFEVLKLLVVYVIGGVGGSAFAPLAIAITLVVWINYFSRLVVYGAAWAMTSPRSHQQVQRHTDASEAAVAVADQADDVARVPVSPVYGLAARNGTAGSAKAKPARFDAGSAVIGATAATLAALVIRRNGD